MKEEEEKFLESRSAASKSFVVYSNYAKLSSRLVKSSFLWFFEKFLKRSEKLANAERRRSALNASEEDGNSFVRTKDFYGSARAFRRLAFACVGESSKCGGFVCVRRLALWS